MHSIVVISESLAGYIFVEKAIVNKKITITYFVSDDIKLCQLVNSRFCINTMSVQQYFTSLVCCDYLFSIVNHAIITPDIIKKRIYKSAINYHDSLLPSYAGLNSITWALLNREKYHGITWHKITNNIDDGEIIYQEKIKISSDETSLTLGLKCLKEMTISVDEMISNLFSDRNLIYNKCLKPSYYDRFHIPDNHGIINHKFTYQDIYTISRALTFPQNIINTICVMKVNISGIWIICGSIDCQRVEYCDVKKTKINNGSIVININDCRFVIHKPKNIYGISIRKSILPLIGDMNFVDYKENNMELLSRLKSKEERSFISRNRQNRFFNGIHINPQNSSSILSIGFKNIVFCRVYQEYNSQFLYMKFIENNPNFLICDLEEKGAYTLYRADYLYRHNIFDCVRVFVIDGDMPKRTIDIKIIEESFDFIYFIKN